MTEAHFFCRTSNPNTPPVIGQFVFVAERVLTRVTAMQIHKCDVSEGWIQLMQPFAKPVFALRPRTLACLRVRSQNANDFRPVLHGHSLPRVPPLDHATNRNRESANNAAVDNGLANALIRGQTESTNSFLWLALELESCRQARQRATICASLAVIL